MKIGLEIHVALPTKTKLFCRCLNQDNEVPNLNICPICMGFPGSKPMLNREALRISLSITRALKCKTNDRVSFVRKIYFYPDLPKSYQITQLYEPSGFDGEVNITGKTIRIRRIQLEEDPAKILREKNYSLLDFNRSGVPLVEIVTEPDIYSEDEAHEFLYELRSLLYYQGIDIDREMKADLNISLADERVEVKNITGIKNLMDAARYEIKRQSLLIEGGRQVLKETRSYDESRKITETSREKESDEEYGFIYEPDLTEYYSIDVNIPVPIIARHIAHELSVSYGFNLKTLSELIYFDKDSLRLVEYAKNKYDSQSIINLLEILKRFDCTSIKDKVFDALMDLLKRKIDITKETIIKLEKGMQIESVYSSPERIDEIIRAFLQKNTDMVEKYKKDRKVYDFMVGSITKNFGLQSKLVSERLSIVLKDIIDNN